MAVEITGVTTTPLSGNKAEKSNATPGNTIVSGGQGSETTPAIPIDKLTLTKQAEELRMIEKEINNQNGIDSERVESLRLEIDAGKYDIDAQRVAEKLIQFEIQFVA